MILEQKVIIWRVAGFADVLMPNYASKPHYCNWEIDSYTSSSLLCNDKT